MKFNSKTFNGELFGKYAERLPKLKRNELLKSGAIRLAPQYKTMMSEQTGGNYITVPLFGSIGGEPVNYDGNTDIESTSTKTYNHSRVVIGRAKAWVERDFSYDITGGVDFMDNVAKQVSEYWDNVDQDTLLSIIKGVFSMTGANNKKFVDAHTFDITKEDVNTFTVTTLNNALQKAVGQNKAKFSIAIMHSAVATNLENLELLEYLKYTDKDGIQRDLTIASLNGRAVLIDDSMPTEEVTDPAGNYTAYTTYALGEGAFEFTDIGAKVPFEMARDPKVNGGQDTLYSRKRVCFAPYGISFTMKSMASASPTDAELEKGTNWELVNDGEGDTIDHKAIPIARIVTRG